MKCPITVDLNPTLKFEAGHIYTPKGSNGTEFYIVGRDGVTGKDPIHLVNLKTGGAFYSFHIENFVDVTDKVKLEKI